MRSAPRARVGVKDDLVRESQASRSVFISLPPRAARARRRMALSKLSGDEQCIIFSQLCNVLDPHC